MSRSLRRVLTLAVGWATVLATGPVLATTVQAKNDPMSDINHIVVIYEENHSFDNLYGGWEGVNGRANATTAQATQLMQDGTAYSCLPQNDVNLPACISPNAPFSIETYISALAKTCPAPGTSFSFPHGVPADTPGALPGGCTEDIVHRFYQEQYQLDGGAQNLYTTGSDAIGLTMGYYDTRALPIYTFLHGDGAPHYAIADAFFQGAFGGSFLNHQFLIAAAAPTWPGAPVANHSIIDSNGMPTSYPRYTPTGPVLDRQLTQVCPSAVANRACGDYAVNTIQPAYQPFKGSPQLPPQTGNNIGDELTNAGVTWAWYSGGWSNADGDVNAPGWTNGSGPTCGDPNSSPNPAYPFCPNKVFQFHHQPFNYFANYAPGTPGRAHLQDEVAFQSLVTGSGKECKLNSVSFVKPIGLENEHPGYTSETAGSNHLVSLLGSIQNSACRKDTMVLVTYDEFGGQWDHVAPPGQGNSNGQHDLWGPGTRIPALILSPHLKGDFVVDHTVYDTTSVLATIEHRFGLAAMSTTSRDGRVNDFSNVFNAHSPFDN
jgi:acid phosphatase